MREMFSRLLPKAYGKDFQVYFLMGLPQEGENTTIKDEIDAEMNQHRLVLAEFLKFHCNLFQRCGAV